MLRKILNKNLFSIHNLKYTYVLQRVDPNKPFWQLPEWKEPAERVNFVYEPMPDESLNPNGKLKLVLTDTVEEIGIRGDVVEVFKDIAHMDLLPSGKAVYASPDNLRHYKKEETSSKHSAYSIGVIRELKKLKLRILMNADNNWTLNVKHIEIAFRHSGFCVPSEAIIPPVLNINNEDQDITLENCANKLFTIKVLLNNVETILVSAYVDLYSKNPLKMKEILKSKELIL